MGMISPAIPIFFSILAAVAMSTPGIEDAVISTLTCVGAEQKSYECLLDYDVEGYLLIFHAINPSDSFHVSS